MSCLVKTWFLFLSLLCILYTQTGISAESGDDRLDTFIEKISDLSKLQLYEIETDQLADQLLPLLQENSFVQTVQIIESIDNEVVLRFFRLNKDIFFNQAIPQDFNKYSVRTENIYYEDELVGRLIVHYERET